MKIARKIIALLLAVLTVTGLFAFTASAEPDIDNKPAVITAGSINVREGPGEDYQRIGGLTFGKMVFVTDSVAADGKVWYKINYEGAPGYILSTYVSLIKDIGMITAGSVNVRQEASESSARVGGMTFGTAVWILSETKSGSDTWYKIIFNEDTAYVKANYVGIMSMPAGSEVKATYKNDITLNAFCRNVPKDYQVITGTNTQICQDGAQEFCGSMNLGNLEDSCLVFLRIYDAAGNLMMQKAISVNVDNSFFSKIGALFGFIFNGFKWKSLNLEVR